MSYDKQKLIDFFRIDTEWGWFAPLAISFFTWWILVNSLLTVEFGIIGNVVSETDRNKAIRMVDDFKKIIEKPDPHLKQLIFSLNEDLDGTSHHRLTARLCDSKWTYKTKPWLLMVIPSVLFFPIGMTAVGVLGYKTGKQPKWLINCIIVISLVMLIGILFWRFIL